MWVGLNGRVFMAILIIYPFWQHPGLFPNVANSRSKNIIIADLLTIISITRSRARSCVRLSNIISNEQNFKVAQENGMHVHVHKGFICLYFIIALKDLTVDCISSFA